MSDNPSFTYGADMRPDGFLHYADCRRCGDFSGWLPSKHEVTVWTGEHTCDIPESQIGTHRSHCCQRHGCKYGHPLCPVEAGTLAQDHPCETCGFDAEQVTYYLPLAKDNDIMEELLRRGHAQAAALLA